MARSDKRRRLSVQEIEKLRRIHEQVEKLSHAVYQAEWLVGHRYARLCRLKELRAPKPIIDSESEMVAEAIDKCRTCETNWQALFDEKETIAPNTMWMDVVDLIEDYGITD